MDIIIDFDIEDDNAHDCISDNNNHGLSGIIKKVKWKGIKNIL